MANILDYLDWRGDVTLEEKEFNEVDNLILSELAYADMDGIAPSPEEGGTMPLSEIWHIYQEKGTDQSYLVNNPKRLLERAASSARFGGLQLGRYVNEVDHAREIQFSAVTFYLPDGTAYVAYRGTDNTIVGWREDFNICYLNETPGQAQAVAYLNSIAEETDCPLRVGGHSKGGNLAIFAAAFCEGEVKERIMTVYSNDGPGFNQTVADMEEYRAILPKVDLILPESSVVGILLTNDAQRRVIKSSANGPLQHDPYTWQVMGPAFVPADGLSNASLFMNEALGKWIGGLNEEQKKILVSAVFDSLDASGAQTLAEMNANKWVSYNAVLKAVREMAPEMQKEVWGILMSLATVSRDVLWNEAKRSPTPGRGAEPADETNG